MSNRFFEDNLRMMISEFQPLYSMDEKESKFKEILDFILRYPEFLRRHTTFKETVLKRIRDNQLIRHYFTSGIDLILDEVNHWELINDSPIINYNYYYHQIHSI